MYIQSPWKPRSYIQYSDPGNPDHICNTATLVNKRPAVSIETFENEKNRWRININMVIDEAYSGFQNITLICVTTVYQAISVAIRVSPAFRDITLTRVTKVIKVIQAVQVILGITLTGDIRVITVIKVIRVCGY